MIAVEQAQDRFVSRLSVTILEDVNIGILGQSTLSALRKKHWPLMRIIVADKAADKADENIGRGPWRVLDETAVRGANEGRSENGHEDSGQETGSRESGHAEAPNLSDVRAAAQVAENLAHRQLPQTAEVGGQKPHPAGLLDSPNPEDSLHPLVNSSEGLRSGNEAVAGEDVAQGIFSGLGDADSGSDRDFAGFKPFIADPQAA